MTNATEKIETVDCEIGNQCIRDHDEMSGVIARRSGDSYIVEWKDGTTTRVKASTLSAARAQGSAHTTQTGSLRDRAKEAKITLDAIRKGQDVDAVLAAYRGKAASQPSEALTDADRAKILARLSVGGQKPAPSSTHGAPAKPAQNANAGHGDGFKNDVSGHVASILKARHG